MPPDLNFIGTRIAVRTVFGDTDSIWLQELYHLVAQASYMHSVPVYVQTGVRHILHVNIFAPADLLGTLTAWSNVLVDAVHVANRSYLSARATTTRFHNSEVYHFGRLFVRKLGRELAKRRRLVEAEFGADFVTPVLFDYYHRFYSYLLETNNIPTLKQEWKRIPPELEAIANSMLERT